MDRFELREKIDGVLNNTVPNWRHEHELIKAECLDQILDIIPDIEEAKNQERERILTLLESYPLNQLQRFPARVEIEQVLREEK